VKQGARSLKNCDDDAVHRVAASHHAIVFSYAEAERRRAVATLKARRSPSEHDDAEQPTTEVRSDNGTDEFLTVDEAAALLKVKASTLRQWIREGRMPCYRLGPRATRFTRPLLREFADERLDAGRGW
jgi:excisionase family DNA binding protein